MQNANKAVLEQIAQWHRRWLLTKQRPDGRRSSSHHLARRNSRRRTAPAAKGRLWPAGPAALARMAGGTRRPRSRKSAVADLPKPTREGPGPRPLFLLLLLLLVHPPGGLSGFWFLYLWFPTSGGVRHFSFPYLLVGCPTALGLLLPFRNPF